MLRALFRIFSTKSGKTSSLDGESSASNDAVVLYALPQQSGSGGGPAKLPELPSERVNHRARLMAMQLAHTRLCSEKRCQRLRELGLVTAGDLASADLRAIAKHFSAPGKANRVLKSYRRAIRLAAAVPGMMPRDALLLISIHRRSIRGLAVESPAALHRDLERFAESTPGRQQLRGRRLPSARRLKRWIRICQDYARQSPLQAPAT